MLFAIIGLRRSGTTFLRGLTSKSPKVQSITFEPHELMMVLRTIHFSRYKKYKYHQQMMQQWQKRYKSTKWYGMKLALNPGIEAFNWRYLLRYFPRIRIIFIVRDINQTYKSWCAIEERERNRLAEKIYIDMAQAIITDFHDYYWRNKDRCIYLHYPKLLANTDSQMAKVWNLLDIPHITGLQSLVRKPRFGS